MRTIPIPAVVLCLLSPLLAIAQPDLGPNMNRLTGTSPLTWFWVAALAVAVVAFAVTAGVISRRNWHNRRRST